MSIALWLSGYKDLDIADMRVSRFEIIRTFLKLLPIFVSVLTDLKKKMFIGNI